MQLQLHYTNYTTPQLQLHYTTDYKLQPHYTTLHPAVVGEVTDQVTTATIAAVPKKHKSNHLSVHQWIRSAIRDSQQPSSPIGFPVLKLPPLPCAVLLVDSISAAVCISGLTWFPFWKKNKTFEATKTLCQHSSGSECKGQKGKNCCSLSKPLLIAGNFWGCTWEGTPLEFLRLPLCTYGAGFLDVREAIRNLMKHVRIY